MDLQDRVRLRTFCVTYDVRVLMDEINQHPATRQDWLDDWFRARYGLPPRRELSERKERVKRESKRESETDHKFSACELNPHRRGRSCASTHEDNAARDSNERATKEGAI